MSIQGTFMFCISTTAGLHMRTLTRFFFKMKLLYLLLGDKGDTCVQCESFGPPGLPGPQGPKGEHGE